MIKKEKVWEKKFKNKKKGLDRFGLEVEFKNYCNVPKKTCDEKTKCWTFDHIWPKSKKGYNGIENLEALHCKNNLDKDQKTRGKVNGIRFAIIPASTIEGKKVGKHIF